MPSRIHSSNPRGSEPLSSFVDDPLTHVRVLFVSFLQGLFAAAPLGTYHWTPDERTEILIRDESPLNPSEIGQRPAISLTIGSHQFYSLGLDDMISYDQDTDRKVKGVLVPGSMSINCISRAPLEAHRLAWIVGEHIWLLRDMFMQRGFFDLGRNNGISPPSPAASLVADDGGKGWFASTVTVAYQFNRKSAFTPLTKQIVNEITTRYNVELAKVDSKGYPQASFEVPQAIDVSPPPPFAPDASDAYGATPNPNVAPTYGQKQPHPLNPAKEVTVRPAFPNRPGLRAPAMNGRQLPIVGKSVKESGS